MKLIAQTQLHHRIPVFQTASMRETVQLALTIDGEWAKRGFAPFHGAGGAGGRDDARRGVVHEFRLEGHARVVPARRADAVPLKKLK